MSFQPTATVCEYPPIVLFAPAPSCDEKPLILLGSLGLTCGILPYRSKIRLLKLLGLTSLAATVFPYAPREAPEAHFLDSPLLPPRVFDSGMIV